MNLYEHQSSYNPNMPVRGLIYFARLFQNYIDSSEINAFSTVQKELEQQDKRIKEQQKTIRDQERLLKLNRALVRDKKYDLLRQIESDDALREELRTQYEI